MMLRLEMLGWVILWQLDTGKNFGSVSNMVDGWIYWQLIGCLAGSLVGVMVLGYLDPCCLSIMVGMHSTFDMKNWKFGPLQIWCSDSMCFLISTRRIESKRMSYNMPSWFRIVPSSILNRSSSLSVHLKSDWTNCV